MNCSTPASLSITDSRSSPKPASIESVMPSSHLILCRPLSSCPQSLPASESFPMSQLFTWGGKSLLIRKDPDVGKDWRQKEKGMTEDEMVGWHHQLNGHEFEQTLGAREGQVSLAYCSPGWSKRIDTTELLNSNNLFYSQVGRDRLSVYELNKGTSVYSQAEG